MNDALSPQKSCFSSLHGCQSQPEKRARDGRWTLRKYMGYGGRYFASRGRNWAREFQFDKSCNKDNGSGIQQRKRLQLRQTILLWKARRWAEITLALVTTQVTHRAPKGVVEKRNICQAFCGSKNARAWQRGVPAGGWGTQAYKTNRSGPFYFMKNGDTSPCKWPQPGRSGATR